MGGQSMGTRSGKERCTAFEYGGGNRARGREPDRPQNYVAADSVSDRLLFRRFHRPDERQFRQAANEFGAWLERDRLWPRRRPLFRWLFLFGGALQSGAASFRRAALDRQDHDYLGRGFRPLRVRWPDRPHARPLQRNDLLRLALPTRRLRSRFLSRRHFLSDPMVPLRLSSPGHVFLHVGHSDLGSDRRADFGRAARRQRGRPRRVAMALHTRGRTFDPPGFWGPVLSDRPPCARRLAAGG